MPPDDGEEEVGGGGGDQAILNSSHLVVVNPLLLLLQVDLGSRGDVGFLDQISNELPSLSPGGCDFTVGLVVVGSDGLPSSGLPGVHGVDLGELVKVVLASIEIT